MELMSSAEWERQLTINGLVIIFDYQKETDKRILYNYVGFKSIESYYCLIVFNKLVPLFTAQISTLFLIQ